MAGLTCGVVGSDIRRNIPAFWNRGRDGRSHKNQESTIGFWWERGKTRRDTSRSHLFTEPTIK
jgi:hypothetical protein